MACSITIRIFKIPLRAKNKTAILGGLEIIASDSQKHPVITSYRDLSQKTKKQLIIETLRTADHPLFPKEISQKTGLNRSTVRVYLRQLLRHGFVEQPFPGVYDNNPTYGVGKLQPPRVHNLRLRVSGVPVPRLPRRVEVFGDIKIQVVFGSKRGLVTGVLSSDRGMDYSSCVLAVERFRAVVKKELGLECSMEDIEVTVCELNEDYQGQRFDGLSCVTVRSFLGAVERLYNRDDGLRSEVQVKPDSVESIYMLLKGGVTQYHSTQMQFMMMKKLEDLVKAIKFHNELSLRIYRLLEKLVSNHFSWFFKRVRSALRLGGEVAGS